MINGLGVMGWGVGGIEAEAVMLGQPISMTLPKVSVESWKLHRYLLDISVAFLVWIWIWIRIRGSMPLTNGPGFGSRRPKNMWIRVIRTRIRLRNAAGHTAGSNLSFLQESLFLPLFFILSSVEQSLKLEYTVRDGLFQLFSINYS
jgi:hypothetical protein